MDQFYLLRAAQLAALADNRVGDSPFVGAVLVGPDGTILGEGVHWQSGRAHAEVNCLRSLKEIHKPLIPLSTIFISLEPCCIFGRTPPCTNLILTAGIRTVVFGTRDTTDRVNGRSVAILRDAGVEVREYPGFAPTRRVSEHRIVFTTQNRPFVQLKYARSADGFLRPADPSVEYWITNPVSRRLVHRWRTRTAAVLVGGATVVADDPLLDSRLFPGPVPGVVVLDPRNRCSGRERLFQREGARVLYFAPRLTFSAPCDLRHFVLPQATLGPATLRLLFAQLHAEGIIHLTVEGGAAILRAFIEQDVYDEAQLFTGAVRFGEGLPAPALPEAALVGSRQIGSDRLDTYRPKSLQPPQQ